MARGNQREKSREKTAKAAAAQCTDLVLQKKKNTMSGAEFQRAKEQAAAIMRAKQEAANARKAAEGKK
ncbi:hypothetical protein KEM54_001058 [Ascosphaera aggregata]|nr:hypothetical protein KEM54_001058 [Ascosphaera aggregata]